MMTELNQRIEDELRMRHLLQIDPRKAAYYGEPIDAMWKHVVDRFGCAFDLEEARKCLAFERYTAAVFHLMRVVETAVLELQVFIGIEDHKAYFGSVLRKLDDLNRRTHFNDMPEHLSRYRQFLIEILPQLHAVKDSWRNKVSHVDGRITPVGVFTEEIAIGIHDATLLLMTKLATGLPAQDVAPLE